MPDSYHEMLLLAVTERCLPLLRTPAVYSLALTLLAAALLWREFLWPFVACYVLVCANPPSVPGADVLLVGIILYRRGACLTRTTGGVLLVLVILMAVHLGCQHTSRDVAACSNPYWTRFFGPGTSSVQFCLLVYIVALFRAKRPKGKSE